MVIASRNKRKDSLKSIKKESFLLSLYMGISWGDRDDKSWLVRAGKGVSHHRGRHFTKFSFSFFSNRTLSQTVILRGTVVDKTEQGGAATAAAGPSRRPSPPPFLPCSLHHLSLEP